MTHYNRRQFLAGANAVGFATGLGALSAATSRRSWAATTGGYKALVFVFLKGGMDHADTVIPYDQASYDQIARTRSSLFAAHAGSSASASRRRDALLALNPSNGGNYGGRQFALPQELSALKSLFDSGDLAIVGNIGPLLEPVTRAQIESGTALLPRRLFSHNDQQSTWMSFGVEGTRFGWGGRFIDHVLQSAPSQNAAFSVISTGSNDVFLTGQQARPLRISAGGAPTPTLLDRNGYIGYTAGDDLARSRMRDLLSQSDFGDRNVFARDLAKARGQALDNAQSLSGAQAMATQIATVFPNTRLGGQLRAAAETINAQQYLNVTRQIFYVTMDGFDTHSKQAEDLPDLHTNLADGLTAFRSAMLEIGRWNDVTLATMSDFGRTMVDNGDGTDHGWAGNQFIMGGSVNGNQLYGDFPLADIHSSNFTPTNGRQIPSLAVEQYAATLGKWFGLNSSELAAALPNLSRFNTSDLGFMQ